MDFFFICMDIINQFKIVFVLIFLINVKVFGKYFVLDLFDLINIKLVVLVNGGLMKLVYFNF